MLQNHFGGNVLPETRGGVTILVFVKVTKIFSSDDRISVFFAGKSGKTYSLEKNDPLGLGN